MKNIFKPEDFDYAVTCDAVVCANDANAKLNKLIESWPVVYGNRQVYFDKHESPRWHEKDHFSGYTHQARLAFIEEIKKEPCRHEGQIIEYQHGHPCIPLKAKCVYCGVELVARWEEKK